MYVCVLIVPPPRAPARQPPLLAAFTGRHAKLSDKHPRSQPEYASMPGSTYPLTPHTDRDGANTRPYDACTNYNST